MDEWLIPAVLGCALLVVTAKTIYKEAKRTPWDLLEAMILFVAAGHAIALPIAWSVPYHAYEPEHDRWVAVFGLGGVVVAIFMVGGAIWVFRRLNRLGEKRRLPRLAYLGLGLLLFPSMTVLPAAGLYVLFTTGLIPGLLLFALVAVTWLALAELNARTAYLPDPGEALDAAERAESQ